MVIWQEVCWKYPLLFDYFKIFMLEISGPTMHSMIIGACRLNKIWDTNPYILSYNVLALWNLSKMVFTLKLSSHVYSNDFSPGLRPDFCMCWKIYPEKNQNFAIQIYLCNAYILKCSLVVWMWLWTRDVKLKSPLKSKWIQNLELKFKSMNVVNQFIPLWFSPIIWAYR